MLNAIRRSASFAVAVGVGISVFGTAVAVTIAAQARERATTSWSTEERTLLRSLSLSSLSKLPHDPSNRFADDARAAVLGERLFSDARLSVNGKVSCATCHVGAKDFQDGTAVAKGVGSTTRRTMPIAGTAHSPWLFWDGRADSQWFQALGPLESAAEHGGSRAQYAHAIVEHYRDEYEQIFGTLPNLAGIPDRAGPVLDEVARNAWQRIPDARQSEISRVYANIGKAIAAYERLLGFTDTRFDRWVNLELAGKEQAANSRMSHEELAGLRLFIGKASCVNCHNGSRFTDDHFHNTGVPARRDLPPDRGRIAGVKQVLAGEFNCLSVYSDAKPEECGELNFATTEGEELLRAYKTPSLRGVAERAPYMHAGQIESLSEVISHYDRAPKAPMGHSELKALKLSAQERHEIDAFLRTLSADK